MGTYSEKLKSGGTLKVNKADWEIYYYFPGPDRRYNGTYYNIKGEEIDKYIEAWKVNYKRYCDLKKIFSDEQYSERGDMDMIIKIGECSDGVYLRMASNYRINTQEGLDMIIEDYEYSRDKASEIMKVLNNI